MLYPNQIELISFLKNNSKVLLDGNLGAGKNFAVCNYLIHKGNQNIIICPKYVVGHFLSQIRIQEGECTGVWDFSKVEELKGILVVSDSLKNLNYISKNINLIDNLYVYHPKISSKNKTYHELKGIAKKTKRFCFNAGNLYHYWLKNKNSLDVMGIIEDNPNNVVDEPYLFFFKGPIRRNLR